MLAGDIKAGARKNRPGFSRQSHRMRSILEASATSCSGGVELDGRAVAHAKPHAFAGAVAEELDPGLFKSRS